MFRRAKIALFLAPVCSSLVMPQVTSAGERAYDWHLGDHHKSDIIPGFALDAATRLGVYHRWFSNYYYPYYSYYSQPAYPYPSYQGSGGSCYVIQRPVLTGYGWRRRSVPVCG